MFAHQFEILVSPQTAGTLPPVEQRGQGMEGLVDHIKRTGLHAGGHGGPADGSQLITVLYACVKAKAIAHGGMPLMVSDAEDRIIESGPAADLAMEPAPGVTAAEFFADTSAFLDLFGAVFWLLELDAVGRPAEVRVVSPLQMQAVVHPVTGELMGWKFHPFGRSGRGHVALSVEQVHVIRDPDWFRVAREWEGLSPRRAAAMAIAQHYKADVANITTLDNGVAPSGVLTMPGMPTDGQIKDLRREVEERHANLAGRGRPMVFYGGLTWEKIGASFSDMEFAELKRMTRTDICAALRVPPAVAGYFENEARAHAEAANEAFWTDTIIPRSQFFAKTFERAILMRVEGDRSLATAEARRSAIEHQQRACLGFRHAKRQARRRNRRLFAWFDDSNVPAVRKARLGVVEQAQKWAGIGVPLNAILDATDAPFEHQPWGDVWHRPIGLVSITEDIGLPGSDDPASGPGDSDPLSPPDDAGGGRGRARRTGASGDAAATPGAIVKAIPERVRARLWEQWRGSWSAIERRFGSRVRREFNTLRKATLRRLESAMPTPPDAAPDGAPEGERSAGRIVRKDVIGSILFDLAKANRTLIAGVGPLMRSAYQLGGEQVMAEASAATGAEPRRFEQDERTTAKLRRRLVRIAALNAAQQRRLRGSLADGLDNAETTAQLAERVKKHFNNLDSRAPTIARTEVGAAVEEAKAEGRRQAGVTLKSWLSSRRETGRPNHLATEIETFARPIPDDQPFTLAETGEQAMHPRDASLPAGESVNCGCTTIARFPDESARAMVDRLRRTGFVTAEQVLARDAKASRGEGGES